MAQTIKLKRSATSGAVPTTASLALGEMAINTYDGKAYIKKDNGTESVVEIGSGTTYSAGTGITLSGTTFSLTDTNAKLNLSGGTLTGGLTGTTATFSSQLIVRGAGNSSKGNIHMGAAGNGTNKWTYLTGAHYNADTESEGIALIGSHASDGVNDIYIGGSIYESNPATSIKFWTHTASTHSTGGSHQATIDGSGNFNLVRGSHQINGTTVIDSSRNLTNIGTITATGGNSTNWNTAYGWGNHASAGYYPASNPNGYTNDQTAAEILTAIKTVDGSGSGLDADLLDGYQKADLNPAHSHYRWTNISASGTQARRFVIMRLYASPAHWDSNWQDIHLKVWSESYEPANLKYELSGDYNGGDQNTMFNLRLKDAGGSAEHKRFRLVLGTPVDAGWDHAGQNTYYVDVYAEASYYMNFTIAADFYSAGFNVNTLPTSGGATSVVYSSPTVSNIATFTEAKEHSYFANHKIWNDGNHGSGSGLDADLLDGQHGSGYVNTTGTQSISGQKNFSSNLGLGTSAPERKLHIFNGESGALASNANSALVIEDDSNAYISFLTPNFLEAGLLFGDSADNDAGSLTYNHLINRMSIRAGGTSVLSIESTGIDVTGSVTHNGSNVGTKIWGVSNDGSNSGLDADLLDGQHGSYYAPASHVHSYMPIRNSTSYTIMGTTSWGSYNLGNGTMLQASSQGLPSGGTHGYWHVIGKRDTASGYAGLYVKSYNGGQGMWIGTNSTGTSTPNWEQVWTANTDGSGSGLDADLLDGVQGSSYLRSDVVDTLCTSKSSGTLMSRNGFSDFIGYNPSYGSYIGGGASNASNYLYSGGYISKNGIHTLWHSGNDGSGSGLDADLLDGQHASAFLGVSATASKALKLAAGGLGPSTENLNTVANSVSVGQLEYRGFSSSSSNAPPVSDNANGVISVGQHSGKYNAQLAFSSNGNMYWRDNPGSSFGSWRTVWDSANDGSGSGLDADAVDGYHAGDIVLDMGTARIANMNSLGSQSAKYSWNNATTGRPAASQSNEYGALLHLDYDGGFAYQQAWDMDQSNLYVRTLQYSTDSGSWHKVWHSGNDGSGSGLDADTLDGYQSSYFATQGNLGAYLQKAGGTMTGELNLRSNLNMKDDNATAARYVHLPRGGGVTFYGDGGTNHSITSRNSSNSVTDDLLISSYGAVYVALDKNNNNTSGADFVITKNGTTGEAFKVSGETGDITVAGRAYVGNSTTTFLGTGPYSVSNMSLNCTGGIYLYSGSTNLASFSTTTSTFKNQIIADKSAATTSDAAATIISKGTVDTTTGYQPQNWHITFQDGGGTVRGKITSSHYSTQYSTSSDYRLKEDIQPIANATERLLAINAVNFKWIDGQQRSDGFIAHELQEHLPEAVTGEKDATTEVTETVVADDGTETEVTTTVPEMQGIDQSKLVPLLVKTIQELEARITALENA